MVHCHCTLSLHTVYCTLHTAHYVLHTAHCILCIAHCTLHTLCYKLQDNCTHE